MLCQQKIRNYYERYFTCFILCCQPILIRIYISVGKDFTAADVKKRRTASQLMSSELMTIFIYFHICQYRDFKTYYTGYVMT